MKKSNWFCCVGALVLCAVFVGKALAWERMGNLYVKASRVFITEGKNSEILFWSVIKEGLFLSSDRGKSWKRILQAGLFAKVDYLCVEKLGSNIYVGTEKGIFSSSDHGSTWSKNRGALKDVAVYSILAVPKGNVFAYSNKGLFKSFDYGLSWQKIKSKELDKEEDWVSTVSDDNKIPGSDEVCHKLCFDARGNIIYLLSKGVIYKSLDQGLSWQDFPSIGLPQKEACSIFYFGVDRFYCLSQRDIFIFESGQWSRLFLPLAAGDLFSLHQDNQGNIYLVGSRGLFKGKFEDLSNFPAQDKTADDELGIREVQMAAISYAEVYPEKIIAWRKQVRAKAFLPKLSASVDRDTGDIWHWESGSTTKTGDDYLMKGKDSIGWSVGLSWDLSELIWNPDQTNIDVRSKLMVELRGDILDQVTRIYFERLRIKKELEQIDSQNINKVNDKKLKVEELSAYLDAMTGGAFSKRK
ncbi:MAG: hypothetical protein MUF05_06175 [Candidatus Omnitrophica bacterium]|jgi:hypothetical protein|nr:hypothetical protein [Candidatus Omnitrophota bacterium]